MNNQKGSVTIFLVIVMLVVATTFGIYMTNSTKWLTENNALRIVKNTSRNIQACYQADLYENYGLLAYDNDDALNETEASITSSLKNKYGKGYLPFQSTLKYSYILEKTEDLSDLDGVANQMILQAFIHVPQEAIENQKIVQSIFEKAKKARAKIQEMDGLMSSLEKLNTVNKKLGKGIRAFKSFENEIKIRINTRGHLTLDSSSLLSDVDDLKDSITDNLIIREALVLEVNAAKETLMQEKEEYPPEFVEKLSDDLDEMLIKDSSLFTEGFHLIGTDVDWQASRSLLEEWRAYTDDQKVLDALMSHYGEGLLQIKSLCDSVNTYEKELRESYESDLDEIDDEDNVIARALMIHSLRENIEEDLEEFLDEFELDATDPPRKQHVDSQTESYVSNIRKNKLRGEEQDAQIQSQTQPQDNEQLSNNEISKEQHSKLPSQTIKKGLKEISGIDHFALTEYLMGTYNHRLTQHWDNQRNATETLPSGSKSSRGDATMKLEWDFYNKLERDAFFKNGELEYIINGFKSESDNRAAVVTEIFLLREASNIVHVYTCKEKLDTARNLAVAVAWPPWTKPIVMHGVLIGWASLESGVDVQKLVSGETVPTIKLSEDDWFTSINGSKPSAESTSSKVNSGANTKKGGNSSAINSEEWLGSLNDQRYDFYIRFLLNAGIGRDKPYVKCDETYVKRALDLIQLNQMDESYDLTEFCTGHKLTLKWKERSVVLDESY